MMRHDVIWKEIVGVDLNQKFGAYSTELQNSNPFSETVIYVLSLIYSLFQKKHTFNSEFFMATLGEGNQKFTPIYIIHNVNFWPPFLRGAPKKFGIKCVFLLE